MTRIKRLLVANRAEIARRIIRTAHRLGLETVAVYSDVDARALHVREATTAVALGGGAAGDTYLRVDKLLAAARAGGADAVHPGYGFLSESAGFAEAVLAAGLTWIGPPPAAIRLLGNKASARELAQSLGVPTLPGSAAADQSDAHFAIEAERIGYPVMVKAAAGGGGRGMRLVQQPAQLAAALASARSEAQAAFGSGELLLERALVAPRHVEVQVFADAHGRCIHLGERDCSVQRRHQKIIEESPSPAVGAALRERMGRCAVQLAQAAGYVGAGTVEFLLDASRHPDPHPNPPPEGEGATPFYLMEMNTRLQVEHPVTEAVAGIDLVEWQLRVAQGEPLPLAQEQVRFGGHAIEVRLCAEDEHFNPHAGTIRHFRAPSLLTPPSGEGRGEGLSSLLPPPSGEGWGGGHPDAPSGRSLPLPPGEGRGEGIRFDHAIFPGLHVSPHYDSMLGKLIAHAPDRAAAIDALAWALDRTELLGLPTNRRLLAACLRHPQFHAGAALIPFLQEQGDALRAALLEQERAVAVDFALAALHGPAGPSRPLPCAFLRPMRLRHRGDLLALAVRERADGTLEVAQDGTTRLLAPPLVAAVRLDDQRWHVQAGAIDMVVQDASYEPPPSADGAAGDELRAPFNGKVIAVRARAGDAVSRGDTVLVLESMKLEHALGAARDGVVRSVHVTAGQQAGTGQVLVTYEALP